MTTQLIVVLLIAVAFALGWWARRWVKGDDDAAPPSDAVPSSVVEQAAVALDDAQIAYERSAHAPEDRSAAQELQGELEHLDELAPLLGSVLAPDHPLLEDFEQAHSSLQLLAVNIQASGSDPRLGVLTEGIERASREARIRFGRTKRALELSSFGTDSASAHAGDPDGRGAAREGLAGRAGPSGGSAASA